MCVHTHAIAVHLELDGVIDTMEDGTVEESADRSILVLPE
jgi:hypothetical protein